MISLVWFIHALLTAALIIYLSGAVLIAGVNNQALSSSDQFFYFLADVLAMPLGPLASKIIEKHSLQIVLVVMANSLIWAIAISFIWTKWIKHERT